MRTIAPLAILAAIAIMSVIGYVVMIDVKPRGTCPVLDETVRGEIDALGHRLMGHVRALAGQIGERNLFRPHGLKAAADYIRQVWTVQGFSVTEEAFEVAGQRCVNLVVEQRDPAGQGKSCSWAPTTTPSSGPPAPTTTPRG